MNMWELTIWPGNDGVSIATLYAVHYNEFAKLVDALAETDEAFGDTIRRGGDALERSGADGADVFEAQGWTFELVKPVEAVHHA
jgi:hypothetical protein